jgi:hypothetical protein
MMNEHVLRMACWHDQMADQGDFRRTHWPKLPIVDTGHPRLLFQKRAHISKIGMSGDRRHGHSALNNAATIDEPRRP